MERLSLSMNRIQYHKYVKYQYLQVNWLIPCSFNHTSKWFGMQQTYSKNVYLRTKEWERERIRWDLCPTSYQDLL